MAKILRYFDFINEGISVENIPTYEECVEMCSQEESPFYESKLEMDGFKISIFNYRLAQYKDFINPIPSKPHINALELRGLCFVFNLDGSLFNRFILLEKFFNLNQVPDSMYSIVKDYKIKYINNKEDGSIASFINLPNGKVCGKSKMGLDNDQANGINRIYRTNKDIKKFVDWTLDNDIAAVFEYVAPHNKIVLRYSKEELILLRLRDNKTGKHIDLNGYLDKIGSIKIAPFEDDAKTLDDLIELSKTIVDKEGYVVQFDNDKMIKIKGEWYSSLHGLLTNDIYREHIIIGHILDDKIDDILGQIPEEQSEARERILKIISIVKSEITKKVADINKSYQVFLNMGSVKKDYALAYRKRDRNFGYVMALSNGKDVYELAKDWVRDNTKRLLMAREWLRERDPSLFFQEPDEENIDN